MNAGTLRRIAPGLATALSAAVLGVGCAGTTRDAAPTVTYIPDASYHLLMAEIALQRREYLTAAQEYLSAANQSSDPELARRATEYAFEYGYDIYAQSSARRWLELNPEDHLVHEYLAKLHLRRNDLDRSLYHLRRSLGPAAKRLDADYTALGDDLAGEDNRQGVTTLLKRLLAEHPDSSGARLALAQAALRSGHYDLALHSARRVAATEPDRMESLILVVRAQFATGDVDGALAQLDDRLTQSPSMAVELERIRLTAAAGRADAAVDDLDRLTRRYGQQSDLLRMHGLISFSTGDLDTATRYFNQLLASGYNVYECFFYLGQIAEDQSLYRQAIRWYSRIRAGSYLIPAQVNISRSYNRLGDPHTGLNHLSDFAEAYPRYAFDLLQTRAQLFEVMGRDEDAVQSYSLALKFKPDVVSLLLARGTVLERLDRLDEALADMQRAVQIAPTRAMALNTLGYTLTNRTRRHREAYGYIRLALELQPDSAAIIDSMGWVLFREGQLQEARAYLELAYAMLPDPEVAAHLGEVLWTMGDRDAAVALWEGALEQDPESEPLNETMQRLVR